MTWRKVKVSEFLTERANRFYPDEANRLGLQRVGKIDFSGNIHLVADKSTKTGMILVKKGDLLISGINAEKGAVAIYDFDEDALATIHYSSYTYDARKINITFLKWFLKSPAFKGILNSNVGNGIKTEIKPKRFLALEMYLPELGEQEKIVKHILAIEGEIGDLLSIANDNITLASALRQSILTEAVQGQLTAQWRKENPNQEHARELLKRIAVEKAQLIKEKKIGKEKPLPAIKEEEVTYELPKGWVWCYMQD
ncbi:MAG: restriction endonuclease subunit S [Saprospiraceae bacterium]|nr:restriction endonuclease subunit S [Saprospiraceae bacterium]